MDGACSSQDGLPNGEAWLARPTWRPLLSEADSWEKIESLLRFSFTEDSQEMLNRQG